MPPTEPVDLVAIDHTLGMELILPVYAPPWAQPLPVTMIIPSKSEALDVLQLYLQDPTWLKSTWFTEGSLLDRRAGGAAVRVENDVQCEVVMIPLGDGQVTEGEIEGVISGTARALEDDFDRALMISDSQAGLQGITSTAARSGQFRAIKYDQLIRAAMQ
ncbi:hypothetical protein B0H17DRAFT_1206931 [Mycena rosella]|uniref:Uncharacterized protein n=1 Tax=Mycena rosella TaxID=1033263 RepID=A0AAD7GCG0_MYCRO|nr:hypothetical protein B0H17DRAFT_1206931 [Mycena rosella]